MRRAVALAILLAATLVCISALETDARTIAFTIDDLPTASVLGEDLDRAQRTTEELLSALGRHGIPAIGFVNEGKLAPTGAVEPGRVALLQQWLDAGLELGNHTFSHLDLHENGAEAFEADIVKGEPVTRGLMEKAGKRVTFFRHPFLHTGTSAEVRAHVKAFLDGRRYTIAPVTIDNADYIFAAAYDRTIARGDDPLARKIETTYLEYMLSVVSFYEQQSKVIAGRDIAHTLLLHANALNAATLEHFAGKLKERGYRFITLQEALKDPVYSSRDEYYGPAGITWLHRWAITEGKRGIFAGEPVVPEWIHKGANSKLQIPNSKF